MRHALMRVMPRRALCRWRMLLTRAHVARRALIYVTQQRRYTRALCHSARHMILRLDALMSADARSRCYSEEAGVR